MPTITASIGLPLHMWEKCRLYKINRSAIARAAIATEIARIENESKHGADLGRNTPRSTPKREAL